MTKQVHTLLFLLISSLSLFLSLIHIYSNCFDPSKSFNTLHEIVKIVKVRIDRTDRSNSSALLILFALSSHFHPSLLSHSFSLITPFVIKEGSRQMSEPGHFHKSLRGSSRPTGSNYAFHAEWNGDGWPQDSDSFSTVFL